MSLSSIPIPKPQLFWSKVDKTNSCWNWLGYLDKGYGQCRRNGKTYLAHRLSYQNIKGPIPPNLVLDHLCRNPSCVNPDHLEAVTQDTNMKRGCVATRTHCRQGHEYTKKNTYLESGRKNYKHRRCRKCHAIGEQKRKNKKIYESEYKDNTYIQKLETFLNLN